MAMIMLIMMLKHKSIVISQKNIKGSAHSDCNINLKFNRKIPIVFHNLKNIILILLCKNQENSVLKEMLCQMD